MNKKIKTKKKNKKSNHSKKFHMQAPMLLNPNEKRIFDNYRLEVESLDEELVLEVMQEIEEVESKSIFNMVQALNTAVITLEDLFKKIDAEEKTSIEKTYNFMKAHKIIENLDRFNTEEAKDFRRSMMAIGAFTGNENQKKLNALNIRLEPSRSLASHVMMYLQTNHANQKRLLNHLMRATGEGIQGQALENGNKALIIFFEKLAVLATDIKRMHIVYKSAAEELKKSTRSKKLVEILSSLDIESIVEDNKDINLIENIEFESDEELKRYQKEKHLDFKELESLAINNGYKLVRIKGDHYIYKNLDKKHSIPIPCRNIGKGLSIAIRKELIKH